MRFLQQFDPLKVYKNNLNISSNYDLVTMSLYRSCEGRHFYGTENEIWAGFGVVGNTEKKFGPIKSNF